MDSYCAANNATFPPEMTYWSLKDSKCARCAEKELGMPSAGFSNCAPGRAQNSKHLKTDGQASNSRSRYSRSRSKELKVFKSPSAHAWTGDEHIKDSLWPTTNDLGWMMDGGRNKLAIAGAVPNQKKDHARESLTCRQQGFRSKRQHICYSLSAFP